MNKYEDPQPMEIMATMKSACFCEILFMDTKQTVTPILDIEKYYLFMVRYSFFLYQKKRNPKVKIKYLIEILRDFS